jgi:hypothetical protein
VECVSDLVDESCHIFLFSLSFQISLYLSFSVY